MDDNRHISGGEHQVICKGCGIIFFTNEPRHKYHSEQCKKAAMNKRYYQTHAEKVRSRMRTYQRKRRNKNN